MQKHAARGGHMAGVSLNKESTIYNYKLVQKVRYHILFLVFYFLAVLPLLVWDVRNHSYFMSIVSYLLIHVLHYAIIRMLFKWTMVGGTGRGWSFRKSVPWIGYLPDNFAAYSAITSIHRHLLWIGLAGVLFLAPWVQHTIWIHMVYMHLWVLMPRLLILMQLRKKSRGSLMKIGQYETSSYTT